MKILAEVPVFKEITPEHRLLTLDWIFDRKSSSKDSLVRCCGEEIQPAYVCDVHLREACVSIKI